MGSTPVQHSVLNVKALVGTFNQEKALVGAFSVIVKPDCETDRSSAALEVMEVVWTGLELCKKPSNKRMTNYRKQLL